MHDSCANDPLTTILPITSKRSEFCFMHPHGYSFVISGLRVDYVRSSGLESHEGTHETINMLIQLDERAIPLSC